MAEYHAVEGWAGSGHGKRSVVIGAGVLAALVIAGLVAALLISTRSSDPGPVLLQAASEPGVDPFTPAVGQPAALAEPAVAAAHTAGAALPVEPTIGSRVAAGDAPGLYGGTDANTCDTGALARFLAGDPGKAAAWAQTLGTSVDAIPSYLATLSPLVLAQDTLITNNGYTDGQATPFQAVLQAGTAVLVDPTGAPRVRCACGNPLGPALTEPIGPAQSSAWDGYDPGSVVAVAPAAQPVATLPVIDVTTGEQVDRPVGPLVANPCADVPDGCVVVGAADVDGDGTVDPVGIQTDMGSVDLYSGPIAVRVATAHGVLTWAATASGMYVRGETSSAKAAWRGAFELTGDSGAELLIYLKSGQGAASRFAVLSDQGGALVALPAPPQQFPSSAPADQWTFAGDEGISQYVRCEGSGSDRSIGHVTQRAGEGLGPSANSAVSYDAAFDGGSWRSTGQSSLPLVPIYSAFADPVHCDRVDSAAPGATTPTSAPVPTTTSAPPTTTTSTTTTRPSPTTTSAAVDSRYFLPWSRHGEQLQLKPDGSGTYSESSGASNSRTTQVAWVRDGDVLDVTITRTTSTSGDSPPTLPDGKQFSVTIERAAATSITPSSATVLRIIESGRSTSDDARNDQFCNPQFGYAAGCGA